MKRVLNLVYLIFKETFLIALGVLVAGFGLKGFLIPNGFIDGGITGVSLLISFISPISLSWLILLLNVPFILLARKQFNNSFALKTFLAIVGLSVCIIVIKYPIITTDKLLVSVFGGFLLGAGIGISVRGGGVLDGTEVLSVYLNKKVNLSVGEIIFMINVVIFSFAAVLLSIEAALYSVLTYLVAYKTVDLFIQGIEEYIGMTIISNNNDKIRHRLIELGKGVTVYKGERGLSKDENNKIDILFTFITRLEVLRIKKEIISIDPNAVIIENGIKEVTGGIIKRRPLH